MRSSIGGKQGEKGVLSYRHIQENLRLKVTEFTPSQKFCSHFLPLLREAM